MSNEKKPPSLTVIVAAGSKAEKLIEEGLADFNGDKIDFRYSRTPALLVAALVLVIASQTAAPAAMTQCVNDPILTLDKYIELSVDHAKWQMDIFKRVPKNLEIIRRSKRYTIIEPVRDRVAPSERAESLVNLLPFYEFKPLCRVKDPDGRWWLVEPLKDGFLTYTPAAAAEPTLRPRKQRRAQ